MDKVHGEKLNSDIYIVQERITGVHKFPTYRDYAIIAYIAYGTGYVQTETQNRQTRRQEIFFLNRTGKLNLSVIEGDYNIFEVYYVLFKPKIIKERWDLFKEDFAEFSDFIEETTSKTLVIYDNEEKEIRNIIVKMISEYYEGTAGYQTMLIGYLNLLVTTLFRRVNIIENPIFSKNMLVDQTIRQIKNTIYDNPKTSEIAAHRFVTREHLGRVFKKETGLTIGKTATPTINTPITTDDTSISGTCEDGAAVFVTINDGEEQQATVDGTEWTLENLTLNADDTISVTAQLDGEKKSDVACATVLATENIFSLIIDENIENGYIKANVEDTNKIEKKQQCYNYRRTE